MKNTQKLILIIGIALLSCTEDHNFTPSLRSIDNSSTAYIKFVHAASDTVGVNCFFGINKVTGAPPAAVTGTTLVNVGTITYSNSFPPTDYFTVGIGSFESKVIVPEFYTATTTYKTKTLSVGNVNMTPGSSYTIAFVGITKNYETLVMSDDLATAPLDGKAYVRFANFIHNSSNLFLRGTPPNNPNGTTNPVVTIGTDIPYKSATAFVALPLTGTYSSVQIVNKATNAVVATVAANQITFSPNKVYTIFARGQIGGTATKAPASGRIIHR